MQTKVEKLPKSTIKLTVTVEAGKVGDSYNKVLEALTKTTEVEGFRKGTAPKEMVREKVGKATLLGDVVDDLLKTYYPQSLKENSLMPISNPQVDIKEIDPEKDFTFEATFAVRPEVKVDDNYKDELKAMFAKRIEEAKKEAEKNAQEGEKVQEPHLHASPNEIIDLLINKAQVEISDILINEEKERLLGRLVNQAQTLGLNMEQYLKSQNKTADQLISEYGVIAEKNLKAELVLAHLVEKEKIVVEDSEIDETLQAVAGQNIGGLGDERAQRFYVKSILQKNKLISQLIEITEGEHHHEHKE